MVNSYVLHPRKEIEVDNEDDGGEGSYRRSPHVFSLSIAQHSFNRPIRQIANEVHHGWIKHTLGYRQQKHLRVETFTLLADMVQLGKQFCKGGTINISLQVPVKYCKDQRRNDCEGCIVQLNIEIVKDCQRAVATEVGEKELRHG